MRFLTTLVVCSGLLLTVAGCDQTDRVFFKQGIGTELNNGEIEASTTAQNEYVKLVCQQAGLAYDADSGSCGSNRPTDWQLFVQAGFNDIDQRCDAYLLWIDYVRRGRDPTLRIISDAATYSALIMDRSGVSAAPIAIAGAAFGFARNTFENVTSRLILEVNHSAVQSVVLTAQKDFREDVLGSVDRKTPPVVIASRPAAIYALRSYMRLCMPVTIEAEINNTVVTFARGGAVALERQEPLVSGRSVGVTVISNPSTDESYKALRGLLLPNGAVKSNPDLLAYVKKLFSPKNVAIGPILDKPGLVTLRRRLAACIVAYNAKAPCPDGSLASLVN